MGMSDKLKALLEEDGGEQEGGSAETSAQPIEDGPMSLQPTAAEETAAPATPDGSRRPDWLAGLLGASEDPATPALAERGPADDSPRLNAVVAGAVNGGPGHYVKFGDQLAGQTDLIAPYRDWDARAQAEQPLPYAFGDAMGSLFLDPANKLAAVTKLIPATSKASALARGGAEIAAQSALGAGDGFMRQYGNTGNVDEALHDAGHDAAWSAALSALPAALGVTADRAAANQRMPEAIADRALQQANAEARSFGIDPSSKQWTEMHPDERAGLLAEMRKLRESRGPSMFDVGTVPQMNRMASEAADAAGAQKDAALAALAAQGAEVNPGGIAQKIMDRGVTPGIVPPPVAAKNARYQGLADQYDAMRYPPERAPAGPAAEPPPPPTSGGPSAPPMPVAPQDLTPVRPSARYQPPPPDPVGALAAQGAPPAVPPPNPIQPSPSAIPQQAPPPAAASPSSAVASPPPPDPIGALAAQQYGPVQQGELAGISPDVWNETRQLVGDSVEPNASNTANAIHSDHYAALMDQAREDFNRANPELASQFDQNNALQGRMLDISKMGAGAANAKPSPFIRALGGLGPLATIGSATLGGIGVPAAAAIAGGAAAQRWAGPRMNALSAHWLSKDTASMMDRLGDVGRAPVGSLVGSLGDATDPAPTPPDPDSLPRPTSMNDQTGYPPGQTLGRATTAAMTSNPDAFMPWADDFQNAKSDDDRAAVVEGLVRRDPRFASALAAIQQQQDQFA